MFSPSQNACNSSPCMKDATCRPSFLDADSFTCVCPPGFTGVVCNEGKTVLTGIFKASDIPQFGQINVQYRCIIRFRLFYGITRCHINLVPRVFSGETKDPWNWTRLDVLHYTFRAVFKRMSRSKIVRDYDCCGWCSDWLQNLSPAFQPMRRKTKTNHTLYARFFSRFEQVIGNCEEFWSIHRPFCSYVIARNICFQMNQMKIWSSHLLDN